MDAILLLGAGKIGATIAELLSGTGDYRVTVADTDEEALGRLAKAADVETVSLDIADKAALEGALKGKYAVLSAAPFNVTPQVAAAAKAAGSHYLDLTEDVESTHFVASVAKGADVAFIPQCGLAPGVVSIVAYDLASRCDDLDHVFMRVGALPKYPSNALKYNLTWSTDGLINECCNMCEAIVDGERREVMPLESLEAFSLDGVNYEAFNTSGGLGTLCDTLAGRVRNLNYMTVRYPGHRDAMKMLIRDLRLGQRRDLLKDILEHALPVTMQDVVLIFVTVSGHQDGQLLQQSYAKKIYAGEINGRKRSAIQITTASAICAMLDLLRQGKIPNKGFVRQEQVGLEDFMANRFGANYGLAKGVTVG